MINADKGPWLEKDDLLVCLGDSLTADPQGYMGLLAPDLEKRGIAVRNAGRSGDKTPSALTRLVPDVIDPKPTAVLIFLGTNDCAIGRGKWADEPRVPPEAYASNLRWIMHLCQKEGGIRKFSIIPPLWRFEGEAWREFGDIMRDYRLAAREAAEDAGARFVPADIAFAEEWARHPGHTGLLLTVDGVHLSALGKQLLCQTILDAWKLPGTKEAQP
mgnify:CR=1 FL=1